MNRSCYIVRSGSWWLGFVVCVMLSPHAVCAEFRTWTSVDGSQVEAKMVREWLGTVYLEGRDGREFFITDRNLSEADRTYLQTKRTERHPRERRSSPNATPRFPRLPPVGLVLGDPEVVKELKPDTSIARRAKGQENMTYHVYIPPQFDPQNPPPILILFHAGGNGKRFLDQVRDSARSAGWIAVGVDRLSNQTKGHVHRMEDEVLTDVLTRIPHNGDRVYLGGGSGGAVRAFRITSRLREQRPFAGVFSYVGWLGGEPGWNMKYAPHMAVAIINGDKDAAANAHVEKDTSVLRANGCLVRSFSFDGGHEIAPARITSEVMAWMNSVANR